MNFRIASWHNVYSSHAAKAMQPLEHRLVPMPKSCRTLLFRPINQEPLRDVSDSNCEAQQEFIGIEFLHQWMLRYD
jgi:hypothetical protein